MERVIRNKIFFPVTFLKVSACWLSSVLTLNEHGTEIVNYIIWENEIRFISAIFLVMRIWYIRTFLLKEGTCSIMDVVYYHLNTESSTGLWRFSGEGKEWKLLGQEQDGSLLVSWLTESVVEDGVSKLQSSIGLYHQKNNVLKVFKCKYSFSVNQSCFYFWLS
jgi:hypothetical protein